MLRRVRWFSLGMAAGVGGSAWVVTRLRRARQRLTPANIGRAAAGSVADLLDAGSRSLQS